MSRYHFHATDGYAAVIDRVGRRLAAETFEHAAALKVREVRRRFGALADLSDWTVVVQDEDGVQIDVLPFSELPAVLERRPA